MPMPEKKKVGGRPKLAEYQKRTKSCQVMFNESDYIYIKDKANKCGLSISEYCHQAAMDGSVKERINSEQAALIRDIAGVANNVNQIAHKMHAFGFEETYHSCQEIINVLLNLINEFR
ncbi:MAG: plasmid mobilization relaxosome protein MobC [Bacteroidaceae bacterium]|nr:plasmid mobilization relaxosome protein MobC [Bacteroidaceae bacterium]